MKHIRYSSIGFSTLLLTVNIPLVGVSQEDSRPNILWFTFEDTSPQFIGCYGNEYAKTPAMDRLAAEGVRFSSAFSTGTISSPSRFCLITGVTPTTMGTGNHRSRYNIPDFVHGFPKYLREAGYYTANNNKTDYNTAQERRIIEESWDENSKVAGWENRAEGQPFFVVINSFHSHQSRTMTNPWNVYEEQILQKLEPSRMTAVDAPFEMPSFYRDNADMRRCMSRVYNSISLTDQHLGEVMLRLEKDGLKDNTIVFCFADHGEGIPRGKGCSLGLGYRVPFIMWIPPKYRHLAPWYSAETVDFPVSFEDFAATVLSIAGVEIPDYMEGVPFMGTAADCRKEYVFGGTDGFDGNGELSRSVSDGHYIYTRVFTCHQPWVRWITYFDHGEIQRLIRKDFMTGQLNDIQAEILEPRKCEYLYDLKNDKWETENLAENPKYAGILSKFRKLMTERLKSKKDAHFIPEYVYSVYTGENCVPYYQRQDETRFPYDEIISAAMLCGEGENVVEQQIALLDHENDIVRYWASVGLFVSRFNLRDHCRQLQEILERTTFLPAKLYLSGVLLELGVTGTCEEVLKDCLLSPNVELNQIAMQILLNVELGKAKKFLPTLHKWLSLYSGKKQYNDVEYFMKVVQLRVEGKKYKFDVYW